MGAELLPHRRAIADALTLCWPTGSACGGGNQCGELSVRHPGNGGLDFALLGVASGFLLAVDEMLAVDDDFKPPASGRDERQLIQRETLEKLFGRADRTGKIVSLAAVFDRYAHGAIVSAYDQTKAFGSTGTLSPSIHVETTCVVLRRSAGTSTGS